MYTHDHNENACVEGTPVLQAIVQCAMNTYLVTLFRQLQHWSLKQVLEELQL